MTVTDAERLEKIKKYVMGMYPAYRAAMLKSPENQAFDMGHDTALCEVQADLLTILGEP